MEKTLVRRLKAPRYLAQLRCASLTLLCLFLTQVVVASNGGAATTVAVPSIKSWIPLIAAETIWLILVGIVAPAYAAFTESDHAERRGLNLPRGSIRSILALLIVGSFVNVLVFAPMASSNLDKRDYGVRNSHW